MPTLRTIKNTVIVTIEEEEEAAQEKRLVEWLQELSPNNF
jgi:hypothetical protein